MKSLIVLFSVLISSSVYAAEYESLYEYLDDPKESGAYLDMVKQIESGFNHVCADTFCEGDYSNWTSLDFSCSVEKTTGTIGTCSWTFAGSYHEINEKTGKGKVSSKVVTCALAFDGMNAQALVKELKAKTAPHTIDVKIGKNKKTIYEQLVDCIP